MRMATLAMVTLFGAGVAGAQQQTPPPVLGPPTHPAAVEAPAQAGGKVLVLPFESLGGMAGNYDWIGRAVQQNLVTELGRVKTLGTNAPGLADARPAPDVKGALAAGKDAGADFVVFGSFQIMDPDLRLNGQVVEVATGQTVATLKSTGTVRDLFTMEDTIALQAKRALAPQPTAEYQPADQPPAAGTQTTQQQPPIPTPVQPAPDPVNAYLTDYNRYTYYPTNLPSWFGYGFGSFGGSCFSGFGNGCSWGNGWNSWNSWNGGNRWNGSGCNWVGVNRGWSSSTRIVHQPIGVGTSAGMVARGMISVPGNFRPNGTLAR